MTPSPDQPTSPSETPRAPFPLPTDLPFVVDRTIEVPGAVGGVMASLEGSIFRLSLGPKYNLTVLSRIDAATGTPTASRVLPGVFTITTGGGYVWVSTNHGRVRPSSVLQLDPTTLATVHTVLLRHTAESQASPANNGVTDMAYAGGLLWVAFSPGVRAIDPATGEVVRSVAQDGGCAYAVAASPDGRRLWTGGCGNDFGPVAVDLRDATTGAVLASTTTVASQFSPTAAGTWIKGVGGLHSAFGFYAQVGHRLEITDLHAERPSGSNGAALTPAAGVLWLTDYRLVQCADLATGHVRASFTGDGLPAYGPVVDLPGDELAIGAVRDDTGQQEVLIAHPKPECRRATATG
ncbi:hypothetical protein acdb102_42520 [Acidothermaceae bacterium B102]|nr:hypothetical protein acdb102_42520 [Acidothermaceae bacterium B102]